MTRWKASAGFVTTALLALGPLATPAAAGTIGALQPTNGTATLRLELDSLTPRVVTADTPKLTVTGRITNTGDRRVDEIQVKVQRGEPVETEAELRDLDELETDSASSPFKDVDDSLERGETTEFEIVVPVRGAEQSLALSEPGVYPTLVNVNGKPAFGGQARLAAVSLPLPVLSAPGGTRAKPKPTPPGLGFVWPILDTQPRRLPTTDGQVVLTDDGLAESLAVNGRLFGLVNSVATAAASNSALTSSMCFAVDPDLLQTVDAMTRGYKVRADGGRTVPGNGADEAEDWLTRLRELTRGQCVISLPYADADLVALSRSGVVDLSHISFTSSSIVHQLLEVQPAKTLFWPAGGTVDQRTLVDVAGFGPTTVLADPGHLRNAKGQAPYDVTSPETANAVRALPVDSLLSRSLTPSAGTGALQDGLAALAFRTIFDPRGIDQVVVTPPRRWTASATELDRYLDLVRQLFGDGFATPRSPMQVVSGPNRGTAAGLSYTPKDTADEIPRAVTADVRRINGIKRNLLDAMYDDNTADVDPNELLSPMQYGLLRAVSTAWRGNDDQAIASVEYVDQQLAALSGRVEVQDPGLLTLASSDSPIPLVVNNRLPVGIVVRIRLVASAGLRPVEFTNIRIPPLSANKALVDAEVIRAGRFTVDASLTTPDGTKLGSTARLEVSSSSYGAIMVTVTGVAGGVLVLLVVLRLVRRVRAARGKAKGGDDPGVPVDA